MVTVAVVTAAVVTAAMVTAAMVTTLTPFERASGTIEVRFRPRDVLRSLPCFRATLTVPSRLVDYRLMRLRLCRPTNPTS